MIPYGIDKPLEHYGKVFKPDVRPGKKFIKRVEKDLPLESNDISIALKLYNNLNEIVEYDEEVLAFNQDPSIEFLQKVYNQTIDMINLTNNRVTCKTHAELYSFFLTKHNIPCVINESGSHRSVYFKAEGLLFNADATSLNQEEKDDYTMDDLTRSKLGLRPNGLGALFQDENGARKINIYDLGLNLAESTQIDYVDFEDRTNSIVSALVNCKSFKIRNIPDIQDRVIDNFSLINNLLLEENLGSASAIKYINTLIKSLFTKEEQKHIVYIPIREKDKNGFNYGEIINFNEKEIREHKHEAVDMKKIGGYSFKYGNGSLEYLTPRKTRKAIEDSNNIGIEIEGFSK